MAIELTRITQRQAPQLMKGKQRRPDLEREIAEFWDKNPDLTAQEVGRRFDVVDETVSVYYRRYFDESFSVRKRRSLSLLRDKTPQRQRSSQIRRGNDPAFIQSVAEFLHDHPEMTTDEVGEQFGISGRSAREYFFRVYKISLAPFRKRFQDKRDAAIRDYIQKNPDATLYVIAKQFGVSEGTISRVSDALRSKNRRKQRKLDEAAAKEYIKENYIRPTKTLARELGHTVPKVNALIGELQAEGFFVNIKRAETFSAYLKDHPDEGYGGAARFFGVSTPFVMYALSGESEPVWSRELDEDFHKRCVPAPYDVAADIKRNKGFGISLPPEEMKRFAALHRMKRERGTRIR